MEPAQCEQIVSDFDLNLFESASINNDSVPLTRYEKQRKAIHCLKRKTISTTSIIQKFYEKKDALEMAERQLLAAKEESRQLSISHKEAVDKIDELLKENAKFQDENKALKARVAEVESQYDAMKSHCNQLQTLVSENETRIEALQVEKKLETMENKSGNKKIIAMQKEKDDLLKHIQKLGEVVLGRRKANKKDKVILDKYCKSESDDAKVLEILTEDEDEASVDCHDDFEDVPMAQARKEIATLDINKEIQSPATAALSSYEKGKLGSDYNGGGSDSGAEVVSDDGIGSSLAFSGSDKCFPSPDYSSNDIELCPEKAKEKAAHAHVTSPLKPPDAARGLTSPVEVDQSKSKQHALPVEDRTTENLPTILNEFPTTKAQAMDDLFKSPNRSQSTETSAELSASTKSHPTDVQTTNDLPTTLYHFQSIEPRTGCDVSPSPNEVQPIEAQAGDLFTSSSIIKPSTSSMPLIQIHPTEALITGNQSISLPELQPLEAQTTCDLSMAPIEFNKTKSGTLDTCTGSQSSQKKQNRETTDANPIEIGNNESTLLPVDGNDNNYQDEDSEVDRIFRSMRLNPVLVEPFAATPSKSRGEHHRFRSRTPERRCSEKCPEAAKIREENSALHTKISDLAKEVMSIKSLLQKRLRGKRSKHKMQNTAQPTQASTNAVDPPIHNSELIPESQEKNDTMIDWGDSETEILANESDHSASESDHLDAKAVTPLLTLRKQDADSRKTYTRKRTDVEKNVRPISRLPEFTTLGEVGQFDIRVCSPILKKESHSLDSLENIRKGANVDKNVRPISHPSESIVLGKSDRCTPMSRLPSYASDSREVNVRKGADVVKNVRTPPRLSEDSVKLSERDQFDTVFTPISSVRSENADSTKKIIRKGADVNKNVGKTSRPSEAVLFGESGPFGNRVCTPISISQSQSSEEETENAAVENNVRPKSRLSQCIIYEKETENELSDTAAGEFPKQDNEESLVSSAPNVPEKVPRAKKMTKLERMRKKLLPKSKIKRDLSPKVLRGKAKKVLPLQIGPSKLNNREAYERAVKVMSELRKAEKDKKIRRQTPPKVTVSFDKIEPFKETVTNRNVMEAVDSQLDKQTCKVSRKSSTTTRTCTTLISKGDFEDKKTNAVEGHCAGIGSVVNDKIESSKDIIVDPTKDSVQAKDILSPSILTPRTRMATRNRNAQTNQETAATVEKAKNNHDHTQKDCEQKESNENTASPSSPNQKKRKRASVDIAEENKRVLRSSAKPLPNVEPVPVVVHVKIEKDSLENLMNEHKKPAQLSNSMAVKAPTARDDMPTCYDDLDMFADADTIPKKKPKLTNSKAIVDPQESVLCAMIDKYGVSKMKQNRNKNPTEATVTAIKETIENTISAILEVPNEGTKFAMNKFVEDIERWNLKTFTLGLLKYLSDPTRKNELFNKRSIGNLPEMTKPEQVLLYIVGQLKNAWTNIDFVEHLMLNIEYTLFRLNKSPPFETIESMSHFYAVLCRYMRAKNRLRLFMMDAMYCMQFKAVPLVRQCLDVWDHVLPQAHLGIAKSPLVTCFVYLLHFFKCEDKFNRVQNIRRTLNKSYSYEITEWNEPRILEMFRNAICDQKDIAVEIKMLRMALIILAKRHGPRWCDNNIIKGILQSIIKQDDAPEQAKLFCVSMLGPLMKPYPEDMRVNVEIVIYQLLDMLDHKPTSRMEEAIMTSLMYMSKHSETRVLQALLRWRPKQLSPHMEGLLRDFVKSQPIKGWHTTLSKISLVGY